MSLQIWLPLTKDLRNQGLSNVTVTNNGATFSSAGKLGGTYEFASGKRIQTTLPSTSNLNSKAISFSCWVNISSWNSSYDCLMSIADGTGWNQSRATLCRNNTASTLCWNIADGNTSTRVYTTTSLSLNTWYHIACTYDGASLKIYINGVLNNSAAATLNIGYAGTFNIGGWSGNNYPINCKMNDIRVYSHCLSQMEIKEIAKGLILHYPLADKHIENSQNLCTVLTDGTGTQTWGDHSTVWTVENAANFPIPVNQCMKAVHTYTNTGTWGGYSRSIQTVSASPSTVYTYSCYMKVSDNFEYTTPNFIYRYEYNSSGTKLIEGGLYNKTRMESVGDGWYRCWGTFTTQSTTSQINISFYSYAEKNTTHWIGGWQIEQKDHMTPFMAPGTVRNDSIIYDCSGYCNNGTRTGIFSLTSDTPRYNISTAFEKGIISIPNSFVTTADPIFSVSLWFKLKSGITYTAYTDLISFSSSSYSNQPFRLELCGTPVGKSIMWFRGPSGQSGGFAVKSDISTDEWYHTVLVSEGNKQYSYYVNGEKLGTYNGSANSWTPTGNVSLGENINGVFYESDVRIYATALSAEDVLELYHTAARIDNVGNNYVYQYIET